MNEQRPELVKFKDFLNLTEDEKALILAVGRKVWTEIIVPTTSAISQSDYDYIDPGFLRKAALYYNLFFGTGIIDSTLIKNKAQENLIVDKANELAEKIYLTTPTLDEIALAGSKK